jgi:hypothetical protein
MLNWAAHAPALLAEADPTVPVVAGAVAVVMLIGLAVFVRIKKRQEDFKQTAERHGFTFVERPPGFVHHWRTLAHQTDGPWTLEIREERVPRSEDDDSFQELTLRLPTAGGLEFLFRPENHWRKLEPVGEARNVEIGVAEFDAAWFTETNQPAFLRTTLDVTLRAHFAGLRQAQGIQLIALRDNLITIRDHRHLLPPERFEHAMRLVRALATAVGEWARQAPP